MNTFGKVMWGAFLLALTTNLIAQPLPPPNTNTYTGGTNTIDWAAIAAAQQADYSNNYAPWYIQDIVISGDGGPQQIAI